jgi:hypothetical protein
MKNAARLVAAVAMVASVLPGAIADGRTGPRLHRLRMDGYVGPPPKGRRERADLLIRAGKKDLRFQVTAATVLSGDVLPSAIFARVRPYRPNFILRGPQGLLEQVADAAPGARLRILGGWRPGSRDLLVSSVETPPSAATSPPVEAPPPDKTPPSGGRPAAP